MSFICLAVLPMMAYCAAPDMAFPPARELPVLSEMPDVLRCRDGAVVDTPGKWPARRAEIVEILLHYEYGHLPPAPDHVSFSLDEERAVPESAAVLRTGRMLLGPSGELPVRMGLYVPPGPGPFPAILALEPVWQDELMPVGKRYAEQGFIFAGFEKKDADEDNEDRSDGLHPLYPEYDWGTLGAWAWAAMRMMDCLVQLSYVDAGHVAIMGHSRCGKTALLAGALDERFALVAPHGSGAGGAGSFRKAGKNCETLELITQKKRFHYWFHPRLAEFSRQVKRLPFDQHFLRALVAPRMLVSMDGLDDLWANPSGTKAMWEASQPVFDLLGVPKNNVAYFRPGGHDTTLDDWKTLLDFAQISFDAKHSSCAK